MREGGPLHTPEERRLIYAALRRRAAEGLATFFPALIANEEADASEPPANDTPETLQK